MKKWILIIALAGIGYLLFFEPAWGVRVHYFLSSGNGNAADQNSSTAENLILRARVDKLEKSCSALQGIEAGYIEASLFSSYPFGFKNEMLISAGRNRGVGVGDPVLIPSESSSEKGGILLGKIEKVFDESAIIMTVFDSRFELAVRVGTSSVDALLKGGNSPALMLIPKSANLHAGDSAYSAGPGIPYGIPIGEVAEVRASANNLFHEASLAFPYDINALRTVRIKINAKY